jgi:hypothetical protein
MKIRTLIAASVAVLALAITAAYASAVGMDSYKQGQTMDSYKQGQTMDVYKRGQTMVLETKVLETM